MALSGTGWAITGSKSPSVMGRMLLHAATNGGSGVVGSSHLQVVATPTPSGAVRVMPGIGVLRSRYPGSSFESYATRNDAALDFPIAPTGSSGARTDYLVLRVEDPDFPGQASPADPIAGPYFYLTTLTTDPRVSPPSWPFVLLAVITIPANTGTITQSMIDTGPSVREMANPRMQSFTLAWNGRSDGNTNIRAYELTTTDGATMYWPPDSVDDTYFRWEVPDWAGQLNMAYTFGNVFNNRYDCWGYVGVRMVLMSDRSKWVNLPTLDWDTTVDSPGDWSRDTWTGAGRLTLPSWARGQTVAFRPIAAKTGGSQAQAKLYLGAGSSLSMSGTFMESAIDDIL